MFPEFLAPTGVVSRVQQVSGEFLQFNPGSKDVTAIVPVDDLASNLSEGRHHGHLAAPSCQNERGALGGRGGRSNVHDLVAERGPGRAGAEVDPVEGETSQRCLDPHRTTLPTPEA